MFHRKWIDRKTVIAKSFLSIFYFQFLKENLPLGAIFIGPAPKYRNPTTLDQKVENVPKHYIFMIDIKKTCLEMFLMGVYAQKRFFRENGMSLIVFFSTLHIK